MLRTHPSSGAGAIGQLVAGVPSGLSLTPPHETKKSYLIYPLLAGRGKIALRSHML